MERQDRLQNISKDSMHCLVCLFSILFFVLAAGDNGKAIAQPVLDSVNGDFVNGEEITITGSGFGDKEHAGPLISSYDNFDPVNNWSCGSISSNWHINGSVQLTSEGPRTANYQSTKKLLYDADGSYANIGYDRNAGDDKLYISWWMYRDYSEWLGDPSGGGNSKFFRVYTNSAAGDSIVLSLWWDGSDLGYAYGQAEYAPDCSGWQIAYTATSATKGALGYWRIGFGDANPGLQKWEHYEIFIDYPTSPGGTDASIILLKDGQTIWRCTGIAIDTTSSLDDWRWVRIGQVSGGRTGSRTEYIDQVYIDNSFAHVFISNVPNISWPDNPSIVHNEIQVVSAWSDNSITFTLNQGSFSEEDTVYLYVVDENGEVNENGYPIIIGGSSIQCDVNQDGNVNVQDVQLVVNVILGTATNNRADVDGSGEVNVQDVQAVVNEVVG